MKGIQIHFYKNGNLCQRSALGLTNKKIKEIEEEAIRELGEKLKSLNNPDAWIKIDIIRNGYKPDDFSIKKYIIPVKY